jgi:general nucleoside transport system permease protein
VEQIVDSTVVLAIPLLLAGLGGLISERAGVLNVALEGQMLTGAFVGAWVAGDGGSTFVGTLAALAIGAVLGALLGRLLVVWRADQVVVGIAFNVMMLGATSYGYALVTKNNDHALRVATNGNIRIPGLADIPGIGPVFDQHWIAFVAYLLVPVVAWGLFRTGAGVRLRACGEYSTGAIASGVKVARIRVLAMVAGGALASLGGAYLVIGDTHEFGDNMTAGRGYIALAVIILGRWNPVGALLAALLFGAAQAADFQLQTHGTGVPVQLLEMTPYLITLISVAILGRRVRPPAEDGKPLGVA